MPQQPGHKTKGIAANRGVASRRRAKKKPSKKGKIPPKLTVLARGGVDAGQQAAGVRVNTIQLLDDQREGVLDLGLLLDLLLEAGEDHRVDEGRRVGHGEPNGRKGLVLPGAGGSEDICQRQVLSGQTNGTVVWFG